MSTDFKKLMAENFGENLTAAQLWALVRFAKNVRQRCRNNAAFNNEMNRTFGHVATFKQVQKMGKDKYTGQPRPYMGLQIVMKDGVTTDDPDSETGEE